jgi:hypothetical protein
MNENIATTTRSVLGLTTGSFDEEPAAVQMRAIDHALRVYFATDEWLRERDKQIPSMGRTWTKTVDSTPTEA